MTGRVDSMLDGMLHAVAVDEVPVVRLPGSPCECPVDFLVEWWGVTDGWS